MASVNNANGNPQANAGGGAQNPRNNPNLTNAQNIAEFEEALAQQIFLSESLDQITEDEEAEAKLEEQKAEDDANNV